MGRSGGGLFDSDSVWDFASELSELANVDLAMAGATEIEQEDGDPPIMSVEDTAKHMNRTGLFDIIFDALKEKDSTYTLIIFVALNMRIGTKMKPRKHIGYLKKVYADIEAFDHLPESREQVRCALEEFKSGEPYTFKVFDFSEDDAPEPPEPKKLAARKKSTTKGNHTASKKRVRITDVDDEENENPEQALGVDNLPRKQSKIARGAEAAH